MTNVSNTKVISTWGVSVAVAQLAVNQWVIGSNPIHPVSYGNIAQLVEQSAVNRCVVGSSPTIPVKTAEVGSIKTSEEQLVVEELVKK